MEPTERQTMTVRFLCLVLLMPLFLLIPSAPALSADPTPTLTLVDRIGGTSADVVAQNGFAYVGDGYGLVVFDVRGATPIGLRRVVLPGPVQRLHLDGTTLAAVNGRQLTLLDLSTPEAPAIRSHYQSNAPINDAQVAGSLLAIATNAGLETMNITDLQNPQLLNRLELGAFTNVVITPGRLIAEGICIIPFTIDLDYCVSVIDATNPAALLLEGNPIKYLTTTSFRNYFTNNRLAVAGDLAVVSGAICCTFGLPLGIVSVIDLSSRQVVGSRNWEGSSLTLSTSPQDLVLVGDVALLTSDKGAITAFTISATEPPVYLRDALLPSAATGLAIDGAQAYAGLLNGGLVPINVSDPTQPQPGDAVQLLGPVYSAVPLGTDQADLLTISRIGEHAQLTRLQAQPTGQLQPTVSLAMQSDASLIRGAINRPILLRRDSEDYQLQLVHADDPSTLTLGTALEMPRAPFAVNGIMVAADFPTAYLSISGQFVGTADQQTLLHVTDFSTDTSPALVHTLALSQTTIALKVDAGQLYRLTQNRVEVYSLSNPTLPAFVGGVDLPMELASAQALAVANGIAYVGVSAAGEELLLAVDLRNPSAPIIGEPFHSDMMVFDLALEDQRLFAIGRTVPLEANRYAVRQYDLSNPLAPTLVGFTETFRSGSLVPRGAGVMVAADNDGLLSFTLLQERLWLPLITH
jgi:hypothetical protein